MSDISLIRDGAKLLATYERSLCLGVDVPFPLKKKRNLSKVL